MTMKWKRIISGALAAALMLAGPVQVMACAEGLEETNTVTYTGGGTRLRRSATRIRMS